MTHAVRANSIFKQIEGFGSYGFPESHAAILRQAGLRLGLAEVQRFPAVFCAALLNSQPMGFYAPAQIVRDAREHEVEVRPIDVEHSRLGLHAGTHRLMKAPSPFGSACALVGRAEEGNGSRPQIMPPTREARVSATSTAFIRRTGLTRAQVTAAGATPTPSRALGDMNRRGGLWQALKVAPPRARRPLVDALPRFTCPARRPAAAHRL